MAATRKSNFDDPFYQPADKFFPACSPIGLTYDDITLAIDVAGSHQGHLNYHHDWITEATSLGGGYDGKELTTPRPPAR